LHGVRCCLEEVSVSTADGFPLCEGQGPVFLPEAMHLNQI
jgi:hypothetical protein